MKQNEKEAKEFKELYDKAKEKPLPLSAILEMFETDFISYHIPPPEITLSQLK